MLRKMLTQMFQQTEVANLSKSHQSVISVIDHAIDSLEKFISLEGVEVKEKTELYYEFHRDMIYTIHETHIPDTYILLNKNLKPVGSNEPADKIGILYEEYKNHHVMLTKSAIKEISEKGKLGYLFSNMIPAPWSSKKAAETHKNKLLLLKAYLADNPPLEIANTQ